MAAASWIKYAYLAYVARPKSDRELIRLVKRHQVCRIVELGIFDVRRSISLIEVAQRFAGQQKVSYTGLDCFDARPETIPALSLKQAHRAFQATGASVRLVPGSPAGSVAAIANAHANTGLLLISPLVADEELFSAWFYVPRMLTGASLVLRECRANESERSFTRLAVARIQEMAVRTNRRAA